MRVGIPSELLKGTVRGSRLAPGVHANEAPEWGVWASGDAENMPSLSHPNQIETSECFSTVAGANEKQMLNFQGIRKHFSLRDRFVG